MYIHTYLHIYIYIPITYIGPFIHNSIGGTEFYIYSTNIILYYPSIFLPYWERSSIKKAN